MDVQLVENNEFLGKDIEDGYAKINGSEEKKIPINVSEEKESKKYFNINATIFIEIITVYFLYKGRYHYIESLEGCNKTEFQCVLNTNFMKVIFNKCVHAIKFFILVSFLIQMRICSIYHIILFISVLIELIIKDHDEGLKHHGILNLFALFLSLILSEIVILLVIYFEQLIKRKKKKLLFFSTSSFLIFFLVYILNNKDEYYCKYWFKGLNNTYIDNNETKYPCVIDKPQQRCLISIFSPFLDFSKNTFRNCKRRSKKEKEKLLSVSNLKDKKNIKRIGYPITIGNREDIVGRPAMYRSVLYKYMRNNLIDMDDEAQLKNKKKPEVIIDFTDNPYGEIKIDVNYNKALADKRKKLEKGESNNIIFLFMDNLSRLHFYRQYKKTAKFVEQFLKYEGYSNEMNPKQKYHGFQFLKYHKLKEATLRNAMAMFSGVYYSKKNKMVNIVKDFKKNGYVTCNIQDVCHKELMYLNPLKKYTYTEFDHEFASPSCDPNIHTNGYNMIVGENSIMKSCLFGKDHIEHCLDYGKDFWKKYKDNKKFLRIVNTYAHEYSGEKSKYADEATYNFLKELYETDQLTKTTLILAADHGFILMGFYKILEFEDWKKEMNLPIFIIIEPDKKNKTYEQQYSEIVKNQQTLVTPFDIFYTMRYIIYGEKYKNPPLNGNADDGECLFKYINPKERVCSKYKDINKYGCSCINVINKNKK